MINKENNALNIALVIIEFSKWGYEHWKNSWRF